MSHSIFCQQVLCYAKKIWATDIITKLSIYGWGKIILMIMTLTIIIIIGDNNDDADDCSGNVRSFLASQHFLSHLRFLSLPNKMALMMITLYYVLSFYGTHSNIPLSRGKFHFHFLNHFTLVHNCFVIYAHFSSFVKWSLSIQRNTWTLGNRQKYDTLHCAIEF